MQSQPPPAREPVVLFVAGTFRCGSTVLDNLLGQIERFTSVGEMRSLWRNGLLDGRYCGCGVHVRECPFWRSALRAAFGDAPPDPEQICAIQDAHLRTRPRQLRGLRRAASGGRTDPGLRRYLRTVEAIYRAIAAVDGAAVIVDSSKVPADAYALATLAELDVRILHLVRDPRAVSYSSMRAKPSPDDPNRPTMKTQPPGLTAVGWTVWNGVLDGIVRPAAGDRYMRLRYEDFATDPRGATARILRFAGADAAELPFVGERTVRFEPTHGPSGNPDRLDRGESAIELREGWRARMGRRDRLAATLPAAPLMIRYGYPIRGSG